MSSLGTPLHLDCNAMGHTANIFPHIPSTCVQYALLSLLSRNIILSGQIYMLIGNPTLIPSSSLPTSSSYLSNYFRTADDDSHT